MKKRELEELKSKSAQQLRKTVGELEKTMIDARMDLKLGKAKNLHLVGQKKKDIAKAQTILRSKELLEMAAEGDKNGSK